MTGPPISVLVVFSNPRNTNSLRLGSEERAIRQSIKFSRNRDNISLTTCHATTIHDLRRALLEGEHQIIHISGHGTDTGLVFEDELGDLHIVPVQALASLLTAYAPPLQCVILNACLSLMQGRKISLGVPFTIAMEGLIDDDTAIEFARGFYDAIGAGRSVEFAYEEGCRTVQLATPSRQFVSRFIKSESLSTFPEGQECPTHGNSPELATFEAYRNSVIADIHNNLVLELYDRPRYEDICVTPLVSPKDTRETHTAFEIHKLVRSSRSAILGEPGSGKTTALRKLCLDLLNQDPVILIPIYISLASFASAHAQGRRMDFWEFVNEEISLHGTPTVEVLTSACDAEIFLLLDGWDEMVDDGSVREVKRFLAQTKYHFIVTSRPEAQRSLPSLDHYEMHPLSQDRMKEFITLRVRDPIMARRIMAWLKDNREMMRLAENPLNLSIMTIVFLEAKGEIGRLTRTKLYERAFDAIIRQHHREHSYDERKIFNIELIMQLVAYQTMATGEGRFFTMRELDRAAMAVLGRPPSPETVSLLTGKLGIIRDRRSGRMEFFHLWYQEFLAAFHVIESDIDLVRELENRNLASSFPYVIGLLPSGDESFDVMMHVTIHDPFNYCRAIPEGDFQDHQIEAVLKRVLAFAETSQPSIPVRVEMSRALARAGLAAVTSFYKILQDHRNSDYSRRAVLEALVILPIPPSELDDLLLEMLETNSLGLLWHVIEQIGKRRIKAGIGQLRTYLSHSDPIVVGDATWAIHEILSVPIADLPSHEINALLECLSSDDRHVQGHALRTLGRLRVTSAIPRLRQHLASTDTGYRWIVPEAAAIIGGPEALGLIDQALDDGDSRVVAAALKALLDLDQDVPDNLVKKVENLVDNTTWIAFLEQPLGNIARTTIHNLKKRKNKITIPKIFIARHCKTSWNKEHRLQGSMDLPLLPEGIEEAKTMASRLAEFKITRVVTSPYKRAYETARIYADSLFVPLHKHPGFREFDHGDWEGRSFDEMNNDPNCTYQQWLADATSIDIPGSKESIYMAQQRCVEALRDVILKHPGETILIVMHKHIRAILQCALKGLPLSEFGRQIDESLYPQAISMDQIEWLSQIVRISMKTP